MTAAQLRSVLRSFVYITVFIVPLIFWRSVADAFDLVKGTTLGILGLAIMLLLALVAIMDRKHVAARPVLIVAGIFVAALLASTVTSMDPLQSVIGQYQRYTGLVTLLASVAVMLSISAAFNISQVVTLGRVLVAAAAGVAFYGFLQELEADPFSWTSESFGKFVFGTMGNPNTGTAFMGVVTPLTAWMMLRARNSAGVRALAGTAFGLSIGMTAGFFSLQGYAAAGFAVAYIGLWAWTTGRVLGQWLVMVLAGLSLLIALRIEGSSSLYLVILAYMGIFAAVGWGVPRITALKAPEALYKARTALWGGAAVVVIAGLLLLGRRGWDFIERELAGSLAERGDFYRAGWAVLAEYPIFGSGLETFGHVFTLYRPAGHAQFLEGSRTSSVHSIHLGMFVNGGVVLGLAYLAVMVMVIVLGVRALRNDTDRGQGLLLAALCAYVGFQVQSSVSVEHVGLHLLHFTLAGIVLALSVPQVDMKTVVTNATKRKYGKGSKAAVMPTAVFVAVAVLWVGVSGFVTLRPIRAAMASFTGVQVATQSPDIRTGISEMDRAVRLAPWEGLWWTQRSEMKSFASDTDGAANDAAEAASRLRYKPGSGAVLARIILQDASAKISVGDVETARSRMDRALIIVRKSAANDPLAPGVQSSTATSIVQSAGVALQLNDPELATALVAEARSYFADVEVPEEILSLINS